uniref:Major facilitator superfamily multidrug transporter NAG4 (N-acetylglucosamine utilization protein 4) (Transmembrane protein 2) n=1 Tax=Ganoderma boninense TaxID=34458 RepID=A0A5K1K4F7_9APHY|nr:Major facilitator superfamily multidrug transporter NAG4 (N-acetylglucosamine utilization protein 4) (Transmembrane protein 2) [Ganoderma boninense]
MGQYWDMFNVDRREKDLGGGGKLGEFFFDNMSSLYESLRIPRLPKDMDVWLSRGTVAIQPGPIGKLSTEVLEMLFGLLLDDSDPDSSDPNEDFLDCIIFAICCKKLLTIGKRHILHTLVARHARAADCRLICLGGYAYPPDQAPPGMLTDAELEEIATTPDLDEDSYESVEEAIARRCLYNFAGERYKPASMAYWTLFDPFRRTVDEFYILQRQDPTVVRTMFSKLDLEMIRKLGGVGCLAPGLEYAEGPRVLCNTTKGEYVREDTLVWWEVGYTIAMCCDEEHRARLVEGPWAGDRFRIVTVGEMPPLTGGRKWKDVTREVNELLCHLLEGEFPEEYRKLIGSQKDGGEKGVGGKGDGEKEASQQEDSAKENGETV